MVKQMNTSWMTAVTESSAASGVFHPVSTWFNVGGANSLRCTYEVIDPNGDLEIRPAIEFSNTVDGSKTVVGLGSFVSTAGLQFPADWTSISSTSAGKQLGRVGWQIRSTTGNGPAAASVAGQFEFELE